MLSVSTGGRDVSRSAERAPFGLEFDRLAVGEITVANSPEWVRAPQHDRRISRGDDFAGDAWMDRQTGTIKHVAVGHHPSGENPALESQAKASEDNGSTTGGAGAVAGEVSRLVTGRTVTVDEVSADLGRRPIPLSGKIAPVSSPALVDIHSPSRSLTSSNGGDLDGRNPRWLPVLGYEGLYEVADTGLVRSARTKKQISQFETSVGYLIVKLFKENRGKNHKVHRLVATAFIRPPLDGEQVNHIDLRKSNNAVSNLEWVTASGNQRHLRDAIRDGIAHAPNGMGGRFKISAETRRLVRRLYRDGLSIPKLAVQFAVSNSTIWRVIHENDAAQPEAHLEPMARRS